MTEKKVKVNKIKRSSGKGRMIILFVAFLMMLGVGGGLFVKTIIDAKYLETTTAVITKIDSYSEWDYSKDRYVEKHNVYIEYEVDGQTYSNVRYNGWHIGMQVGQEISIKYDTRKPHIITDSPVLVGAVSVVVAVASIIPLWLGIKDAKAISGKSKNHKNLIETGVKKRLIVVFVEGTDSTNKKFIEKRAKTSKYVASRTKRVRMSRRQLMGPNAPKRIDSPWPARVTINEEMLPTYEVPVEQRFVLGCEYEGLIYDSEAFYYSKNVKPGCTADVYFDKKQHDASLKTKKRITKFFIDLDSLREGDYVPPEYDEKLIDDTAQHIEGEERYTTFSDDGKVRHKTKTVKSEEIEE